MRIKDGVILAGLQLVMRPVLQAADRIWRSQNTELVVTSGLEGEHSAGSFHYYGLALDLRFPPDIARAIRELRAALGPSFDVVEEKTHIHVEYDP